mgnify:CR=1 FL=1
MPKHYNNDMCRGVKNEKLNNFSDVEGTNYPISSSDLIEFLSDVFYRGETIAYGKGDGGDPFVVLSASADRGERPLDKGGRPRAEALSLALQGVEVLAGLHRSGLLLPDARRHRFLVTSGRSPRLRLADLGGLRRASSEECEEQLVLLAHRLCRDLLGEHEEALSAALRSFVQRGGVPAAQWVRALAVE